MVVGAREQRVMVVVVGRGRAINIHQRFNKQWTKSGQCRFPDGVKGLPNKSPIRYFNVGRVATQLGAVEQFFEVDVEAKKESHASHQEVLDPWIFGI
jgi:hypothetical protein